MEVKRPGTPEWARKIIAEQEKSMAEMKKWSEGLIDTLKGISVKAQRSTPSKSTSHKNSVTPPSVGFTHSLYSAPRPVCRTCRQQFPSCNALFVYLNVTKHFLKLPKSQAKTSPTSSPTIITSNTPSENVETGAAYKDFSY